MNEVRTRTRKRALDVQEEANDILAKDMYIRWKRVSYGQEEEETERVRVPNLPPAHARVSVGASVTHNMGDYNSCKVEVFVSLPCLSELSEIERVYNIASKKVEQFIDKEQEPILKAKAEAKKS